MGSPASEKSVAEGVSLYRQRKYAEARTLLRKLVTHEPANADAWNVLGYLERDIGDVAAAAAAFEQALNLQPDDVIALKGRARMALERAEAPVLERYDAALKASPGDPQLVLEQTEARLSEGDDAAIDDFAQFLLRKPEWTDGQIALARMLWE